MATTKEVDQRAGAEIVYGAEDCYRHSLELLQELGFPKGVLPLKDLVECGRVRETGFVWMKQKAPMKKMTGVKSKQVFIWVPIAEMSIDDATGDKMYFKTPMGIGKSFPVTAFMTEEEEEEKYLKDKKAMNEKF
ncbi:embryoproteinsis-associated protein EMB8 [Hibiscus syriacus]|uniref:Embryoproteinsis-associated protein EMB8 n=1 Tax=Hibiscus syriacus TaxID=106335 RepID=A0A6A2WPM5_HIBSY|nr:embryoproteinsis-associated protein EMB8 [Hibiscus syriacus]